MRTPTRLRKFSFLLLLMLWLSPPVTAQQPSNHSIDSLISRIPAMIRSDEQAARKMIDELWQRSKQYDHQHGIIQTVFFKVWLSYRHNPPDVVINSIDSALRTIKGIETDTA
ncbi:MAG: hypothetical protein WCF67_22575, partial [Chitinophagaceae bacterium]